MEIDQVTLQQQLANASCGSLLDVREDYELARGILPGAIHIPMSQLETRVSELSQDAAYVVYCEHGVRSLHVTAWMIHLGYKVQSLAGGFAEWRGPVQLPETR